MALKLKNGYVIYCREVVLLEGPLGVDTVVLYTTSMGRISTLPLTDVVRFIGV